MAAHLGKKVLVCAPSNTAVDGLAMLLQDMMPKSFQGVILRDQVSAAERYFVSPADEDPSRMAPQTKENSETLALTQFDAMDIDDLPDDEPTMAATEEMRNLGGRHCSARSMLTAAHIRRLAIVKNDLYKKRDPQSLSEEELKLKGASKTIVEALEKLSTMEPGQERRNLAWDLNEALEVLRAKAYRECPIVITTCGNAANTSLRAHFAPDLCFIDEAAQATETAVLIANTAFDTIKQRFLYGDDFQLAFLEPLVLLSEMANQADMSTFKRLRNLGLPVFQLKIQYRMTETGNKLTNHSFYDGEIQTADSMKGKHKITESVKKFIKEEMFRDDKDHDEVVFVDVPNAVAYKDQFSYSTVNPVEAIMASQIICSMLLKDPDLRPEDFGVICMYKAQIGLIRKKLKQTVAEEAARAGLAEENLPDTTKVICYTVDSSQGQEVNISIVSIGACGTKDFSNKSKGVDYTEWDNTPYLSRHVLDFRRVNVSTSRHRYGMIILGNREGLLGSLEKYKNVPKFRTFLENCAKFDFVYHPRDLAALEETEDPYILTQQAKRQQLIDAD